MKSHECKALAMELLERESTHGDRSESGENLGTLMRNIDGNEGLALLKENSNFVVAREGRPDVDEDKNEGSEFLISSSKILVDKLLLAHTTESPESLEENSDSIETQETRLDVVEASDERNELLVSSSELLIDKLLAMHTIEFQESLEEHSDSVEAQVVQPDVVEASDERNHHLISSSEVLIHKFLVVQAIESPESSHIDRETSCVLGESSLKLEELDVGISGSEEPTIHAMMCPPTQTMERLEEYDPLRIPLSVFEESRSATPTEWSSASNDSLFSIPVCNSSLSKNHSALLSDLPEFEEYVQNSISEEKLDGDNLEVKEEREDEKTIGDAILEVLTNKAPEEEHMLSVQNPNPTVLSNNSSSHSGVSEASDASHLSFAFPILQGGMKSESMRPESDHPRPNTPSIKTRKTPKSTFTSHWLSCCSHHFCCCSHYFSSYSCFSWHPLRRNWSCCCCRCCCRLCCCGGGGCRRRCHCHCCC